MFKQIIAVIADVVGIASFALTVALLIRSESLRKQIDLQKREYQENQKDIKVKMIALRENLWSGQPLSLKLISEIRTHLYSFKQKFGHLRTLEDRRHLKATLRMLQQSAESISVEKLCGELDYFIARFERQELK